MKKGDVADRVEAGVVDELAGELIEGYGLGLVLRPHEANEEESRSLPASATPALLAAE